MEKEIWWCYKAHCTGLFLELPTVTCNTDDFTMHESKPPLQSEKWIVQLFGHAKKVQPLLGLPNAYNQQLLLLGIFFFFFWAWIW